ncbi:DUF2059 domain-containing protein [Sulfitobacter guttiformis]|uniref:Uncharacterized protein DUF2059 n=1 Tax=Sulfitobacter guttiformis TaxID=74349 RepID=A0A420DHW0_9RHOB|nr:DUF2059 domain-containing protein [Sulfitobacter guttiformis]KIN72443.1 DUF2059 domain containing protein [Sulfitobacter guttiformis KCTC 32187]RKE93804.1 uncharacterized protein DUF2059 [Sulfitobacter guttiformis]
MQLIRHAVMIPIVTMMLGVGALGVSAQTAPRESLEAFLEVTGFDVALESIALSADAAPEMLGLQADDFGSEWQRLVGEVFETSLMHDMAVDILAKTLTEPLLVHAADFYATDLGQRLVVAENSSHMIEQDGLKSESGAQIIEGLNGIGSPRVAILERLNRASGSEDSSVRSIQEVQIRFLMAAAGAGVIELQMDEPDLREAMAAQEEELRASLRVSALEGSAYTYQAFSDEEMVTYAEALEKPEMKQVYDLMNAVQYEIMADRFEAVAARLRLMQPSQDL